MRYTREIFDILSKGGFISQNSISQQRSHLYDAIEDDFNDYREYFSGIGFLLEGGNGYYYFSRTENRVDLTDKVQRLALWIDRVDFLKTFNNTFASGFTSSKTTLTDYQCVSTGCCTHVAKTEITIDNQHVTKSLQRYRFLPKQPKENTEKITNLPHFLILVGHRMLKWEKT